MPSRSIFGLFNVPAKLYPWVLLVILSLLLPNISFLGHLSGILVGVLFVSGFCNLIIPSISFQKEAEQYSCCTFMYKQSNYIRCTDASMQISDFFHSSDGVAGWIKPLIVAVQQIYFLTEALLHVCGCPTARISSFIRGLVPSSSNTQQNNFGSGSVHSPVDSSERLSSSPDGRGSFRSVPTSSIV